MERAFEQTKLPLGWRFVRLGDHVMKIGSGYTPQGGYLSYVRSGIPLIRSQNVHMNRFLRDGLAFISTEQDEQMSNTRVQADDVLLNITGASIGRVCVAPAEICPANVNQHVSIIRLDVTVDPAFLAFFIASPAFQRFIIETQAGATRQALTKALIEDFKIPFPPLPEQNRIAAILNEQLAAIGQARTGAIAQLEAAESLYAAYLRFIFQSPEAQGWPAKRVDDIADLLPSKSISTDGDAEVLAITTACLTETGFQASGIKKAKMWESDAAECIVSKGEILVARSNTPELVGRVAMFNGEPAGVVASDLTIRINSRPVVQAPFLAAYLSHLYLSGYWKDRAGGASGSMKKITRTQILEEKVPVPTPPEQESITAMLHDKMEAAKLGQRLIEDQLDAINKLPSALLRQAFKGEL